MQAESSSNAAAAQAALPLFARGVVSLLACWPALRIAVTHNWIPKRQAAAVDSEQYAPETAAEKRTRLAEELVDAYFSSYVENDKVPDSEEIEDFLFEFIEVEYGVALEDASEIRIAKDCRELWNDSLAGQMDNITKFERMAAKAREEDNDPSRAMRGTRTAGGQEDDGNDSDSSDDDVAEGGRRQGVSNGMDVDEPMQSTSAAHPQRQEPEVDEDGFTTVVSKKGGRR